MELAEANTQLQTQLVAQEMDTLEDVLEMLTQFELNLATQGEACQPIITARFTSVSASWRMLDPAQVLHLVTSHVGCVGERAGGSLALLAILTGMR